MGFVFVGAGVISVSGVASELPYDVLYMSASATRLAPRMSSEGCLPPPAPNRNSWQPASEDKAGARRATMNAAIMSV